MYVRESWEKAKTYSFHLHVESHLRSPRVLLQARIDIHLTVKYECTHCQAGQVPVKVAQTLAEVNRRLNAVTQQLLSSWLLSQLVALTALPGLAS